MSCPGTRPDWLVGPRFTVEDADDHYRPRQLRVVDAPLRAPLWESRADELTVPGRQPGHPWAGAG
ncbi:hypothetical protein JQK87_33455 [Streptomyces sp. G44]|uniref:hypothetical protein n=1 Tax=Streptomyces sp. G44 TaxID=2807632 RepID=UPI0019602668|nr:hypothetical protein [Streptomyces sp. G44]MBM7173208.1 hypothetical protein [Streptomyces sp. G44]